MKYGTLKINIQYIIKTCIVDSPYNVDCDSIYNVDHSPQYNLPILCENIHA